MKFREGAASFYIVAFSTLILTVVAMSFAAVIISEITRTTNDDLAQSAYDSALAGIEDAKLAYYNYLTCKEDGNDYGDLSGYNPSSDPNNITCKDIIYWVEKNPDCDTVAHILGRIKKDETKEVYIRETAIGGEAMQQAYTCVEMRTDLSDYRGTLSESNPTKVVQVKTEDVPVSDIKTVKVSWYSDTDGAKYQYTNFVDNGNGKFGVTFPLAVQSKIATPPTISVGIVQTGMKFKLDDFDRAEREIITDEDGRDSYIWRTNRGIVYLVPMDKVEAAAGDDLPDNYIGAYNNDDGKNMISAQQVVKSNDQTVKNLPYGVYCNGGGGQSFACSAEIELPDPIVSTEGDKERNNETFMIVVSVPYGLPSTDFALEFCGGDDGCISQKVDGDEVSTTGTEPATLSGMQVKVDSTGRANDMYRRIEARMDIEDAYYPYPMYAIELLGKGNTNLVKNFTVDCEAQQWGGWDYTCAGGGKEGVWEDYDWTIPQLTINYNANGGTGSVESQKVRNGIPVTIQQNGFSYSGARFVGWNTKPDGTGDSYEVGKEYTFTGIKDDNETMTLYAQWDDRIFMQEFSNEQCRSLASSNNVVIYDERDGQSYTVRYINDNCWMTQNLNLASGKTITNADSNVAAGYTYTIPGNCNSYTTGCAVSDTDRNGRATMYYNYCAASAGTACNNGVNTDTTYDICPAGWALPTYSQAINVRRFSRNIFSPVTANSCKWCTIDNNNANGGVFGFWWTSGYASNGAYSSELRGRIPAQHLLYYNGRSGSLGVLNQYHEWNYKHFVRCVKK